MLSSEFCSGILGQAPKGDGSESVGIHDSFQSPQTGLINAALKQCSSGKGQQTPRSLTHLLSARSPDPLQQLVPAESPSPPITGEHEIPEEL